MTSLAPARQARRLFVVAAFSALALSGCQTGRPSTRPQPQQPEAVQRHQVALLAPLTGEDAAVGQSIANAARLALVDSGNQSIQLTLYNTAQGGAAAAAGLAIAAGNRLILGPLLGDDVRAVAPAAKAANVPVIAYSNDVSVAGDGVYILGFAPNQAIDRVIAHARATGATRFAAIVPNSTFGQRATQAFFASVQRAGGTVTGVESYAGPDTAKAAARRLSNKGGFDAVLIGDGPRAAALLAPSIRVGPRVLGPHLWAGSASLGTSTRLRGAWFAAPSDTRFNQLVTRYKARYGSTPDRLASLGYDSVLLTVRAAQGWTPGRRFPERALGEDEGFVGVDGVFRFGRDGVAQRAFELRQVTSTGAAVVAAAPTSFK
jgi:ABC-type branched-subunit amino acid transport system substrate-binding protein